MDVLTYCRNCENVPHESSRLKRQYPAQTGEILRFRSNATPDRQYAGGKESHDVVELIAERSVESAADWFARHREVKLVCRDRCGLYSQAAREGAPQAQQIVDLFHVLLLPETDGRGASGLDDDLRPSRRVQRDALVAMFDRVQALPAAGKTLRNITETISVTHSAVRQWVRFGH